MTDPWLVLGAAVLEAAIGYPAWLHKRIPHPVTWVGAGLARLEKRWNDPDRKARKALGVATVVIIAGGAAFVGYFIERWLSAWWFIMIVATLGLAQRSLYDHVVAVLRALDAADLLSARVFVARIVGRDVGDLDTAGVAAAALESLAESFNDGVAAPLFWFLLGGLPGLFAYKAINTADSMIGHMEPRWRVFGWAAARTDDVANFVPARLAGMFLTLAAGRGWQTMLTDARKHASPNAGWPEAAMAGALGIQLGGPAHYDGVLRERRVFGSGPRAAAADLRRGLALYMRACGLIWACLAAGGLLWRH